MLKDLGNAQDLVTIKEIREGTVVMKNGSMRQVAMVGGLNLALKSETEQNIITQAYQNFLNSIDFPLQFIVHSRKVNIESYLETLKAFRTEEISPLLQNQNDEYRAFIRSFVEKNAIMEKTFLVVVPFTPIALPPAVEEKKALFSFLGKKKVGAEARKAEEETAREASENFMSNLEQLRQRTAQVVYGLSAIGLDTIILNDEQLVELYYNFYNPEATERKDINLPTT